MVVMMAIVSTMNAASIEAATLPTTPLADAGANGNFSVSPAKIELDVMPGETATREITIQNRTGATQEYSLSVEDMAGTNGGAETVHFFGNENGPNSLRNLVTLPEGAIMLASGSEVRVPVTIKIPAPGVAGDEPGGRYGSVFITATPASTNASGAGVASRIGVLVFVRVPGEVKEEGVLKKFGTLGGKKVFAKGDVAMTLLFENSGNVHVNPYGIVTITNMFGREVAVLPLDPWFALPNSLRTRDVIWNTGNAFGIFTATASVNRGYQDIVDTAAVTLVVISPLALLIVVVALIALAFGIRRIVRARRNRKVAVA